MRGIGWLLVGVGWLALALVPFLFLASWFRAGQTTIVAGGGTVLAGLLVRGLATSLRPDPLTLAPRDEP